jgi:hypothetical protein
MCGLRFRGKRQRETTTGKKAQRIVEELREGAELLIDAKTSGVDDPGTKQQG